MNILQRTELDRFLTSGSHDNLFKVWTGDTFVGRARNGDTALRSALISAVTMLAGQVAPAHQYFDLDISTRAKFAPMVRGIFPQSEQSIILDMLDRSVVFLTPSTINTVLEKATWLNTAWNLANIYLASLGAKTLTDDAQAIVGLSEETTCYVSMKYFSNNNPLEDYVIHEAARIFTTASVKRLDCPQPVVASGCSKSIMLNAKPLPIPAKPIAEFLSLAKPDQRAAGCYQNLPKNRCRLTSVLMVVSMSIFFERPFSPGMAGSAFLRGALPPSRHAACERQKSDSFFLSPRGFRSDRHQVLQSDCRYCETAFHGNTDA